MNSWIDLHALWQIVVVSLICGAGLPAVFAVGLKALDRGGRDGDQTSFDANSGAAAGVTANPLGVAVAALCFAVVLAAIGWGIYLIVAGT